MTLPHLGMASASAPPPARRARPQPRSSRYPGQPITSQNRSVLTSNLMLILIGVLTALLAPFIIGPLVLFTTMRLAAYIHSKPQP